MRRCIAVLAALLGVGVLGAAVWMVLILDPYEWGVVQSEHFTWEKFAAVHEGERVEDVISRLGAPVRGPDRLEALTRDPADPCVRGHCMEYIFAGANWGASYKEAIVIADEHGRVVFAHARQE